MKRIKMEMPTVARCQIDSCAYNVSKHCHAKAITIGDSTDPECDTFLASPVHAREVHRIAGVGACKVSGCRFNQDFECAADSISVGTIGATAHCLTYLPKPE